VTVQPQPLEYARPKPPRIADRHWLMTAYGCGALPLIVGIATAGLYLLTYAKRLESIGLLTVIGGVVLVGVGGIAWLIWLINTHYFGSRRWWLQTVGALMLLLANFPGCAICMHAVMFWRFTVFNHTSVPMTVTIASIDAGETRTIGPIAPGKSERFRWYLGDEPVDFKVTATGGATTIAGGFDVYLGAEGGPDLTITLNADGTMTTP
jgi:hypothetical protein